MNKKVPIGKLLRIVVLPSVVVIAIHSIDTVCVNNGSCGVTVSMKKEVNTTG